jgi:hypothetical protein
LTSFSNQEVGVGRPAAGDTVSIRVGPYDDDPWVNATVTDLLSVQFTCDALVERPDGGWVERVLWGFYRDEGSAWKLR